MEIAIIGAGAWGTALSIVLGGKQHKVRLWAHEPDVARQMCNHRENKIFLPGHKLPASVIATQELQTAMAGAELILWATPSNYSRAVLRNCREFLSPQVPVVSATKGIENESLLRMTEVIAAELGGDRKLAALSGPSFAHEVARGDPTAVTVATVEAELAALLQREISGPSFRVYTSDDVIGVELGGALKNVIAIAAGACDGLGLGHNSVAALITRGLTEMTRLVTACGGRVETMSGLAGLGDLVLTCTGGLSRNRSVGVELGRGKRLPEIIAGMHGMVAEGVFTTDAAVKLARAHRVEMPITEQIHAVLNEGKSPRDAIHELMTRSSKSELASSHTFRQT